MNWNELELRGQRFGRLMAIERVGKQQQRRWVWRCRCDCGAETLVNGHRLKSGHTKSCGCLAIEILRQNRLTHGETIARSTTPEYRIWQGVLRRCREQQAKTWKRYGGRGITVCDLWLKYEAFLADMGRRPTPQHSLDRYPDNDGNYEPDNCRWATKTEQANNRGSNRLVCINGEVLTFVQAARKFSIVDLRTARSRYDDGWSADEAFFTPLTPAADRWRGANRKNAA